MGTVLFLLRNSSEGLIAVGDWLRSDWFEELNAEGDWSRSDWSEGLKYSYFVMGTVLFLLRNSSEGFIAVGDWLRSDCSEGLNALGDWSRSDWFEALNISLFLTNFK